MLERIFFWIARIWSVGLLGGLEEKLSDPQFIDINSIDNG